MTSRWRQMARCQGDASSRRRHRAVTSHAGRPSATLGTPPSNGIPPSAMPSSWSTSQPDEAFARVEWRCLIMSRSVWRFPAVVRLLSVLCCQRLTNTPLNKALWVTTRGRSRLPRAARWTAIDGAPPVRSQSQLSSCNRFCNCNGCIKQFYKTCSRRNERCPSRMNATTRECFFLDGVHFGRPRQANAIVFRIFGLWRVRSRQLAMTSGSARRRRVAGSSGTKDAARDVVYRLVRFSGHARRRRARVAMNCGRDQAMSLTPDSDGRSPQFCQRSYCRR